MNERKETFIIPQYDYEIEVVVTDNFEKSRAKYDEFIGSSLEYSGGTIAGLHSYNEDYPKSILFFKHKTSIGTIAHEAFHCVTQMYRFVDTKLTNSTEEVYAYTLGYVVDKCCDIIYDRKKKKVSTLKERQ